MIGRFLLITLLITVVKAGTFFYHFYFPTIQYMTVTVGKENDVYIGYGNGFLKLDRDGNKKCTFYDATLWGGSSEIAPSVDGVYVSTNGIDQKSVVEKVDFNCNPVWSIKNIDEVYNNGSNAPLTNLIFDADANVYGVIGSTLYKISAKGDVLWHKPLIAKHDQFLLSYFGDKIHAYGSEQSIVVDRNGRILSQHMALKPAVVDAKGYEYRTDGATSFSKFNPLGSKIWNIEIPRAYSEYTFAFDADDNIYLLHNCFTICDNSILKIDKDGSFVDTFLQTYKTKVEIAVSADGTVYAITEHALLIH